jgi:uncharacterized protein
MTAVAVTDVPSDERYEARVDGEVAGFLEYRRAGNVVVLAHTEVLPAFGGRGVGGRLVRAALDEIRARGDLEVVPTCPFVARWIATHMDYVNLVTPSLRSQFVDR